MKRWILLSILVLCLVSCKKELTNLSGTTWVSSGTTTDGYSFKGVMTFTSESFSITHTYPLYPSLSPLSATGTYTYAYPKIYFYSSAFTDIGQMSDDYKSFTLGRDVFIRE